MVHAQSTPQLERSLNSPIVSAAFEPMSLWRAIQTWWCVRPGDVWEASIDGESVRIRITRNRGRQLCHLINGTCLIRFVKGHVGVDAIDLVRFVKAHAGMVATDITTGSTINVPVSSLKRRVADRKSFTTH